jgi:hypothetical protein
MSETFKHWITDLLPYEKQKHELDDVHLVGQHYGEDQERKDAELTESLTSGTGIFNHYAETGDASLGEPIDIGVEDEEQGVFIQLCKPGKVGGAYYTIDKAK